MFPVPCPELVEGLVPVVGRARSPHTYRRAPRLRAQTRNFSGEPRAEASGKSFHLNVMPTVKIFLFFRRNSSAARTAARAETYFSWRTRVPSRRVGTAFAAVWTTLSVPLATPSPQPLPRAAGEGRQVGGGLTQGLCDFVALRPGLKSSVPTALFARCHPDTSGWHGAPAYFQVGANADDLKLTLAIVNHEAAPGAECL